MAKSYKTANGKLIDMDGLRLKNEETIALGNMRTNARGDELGPGGKVIKTRNERMNENYKLHSMVPKDDLVHDTLDMAHEKTSNQKTGIESQARGGLAASVAKPAVNQKSDISTKIKRI